LIILYVINIVGFVLKALSNDANFIQTIFIYLKKKLSNKKHIKRRRLIPLNGGSMSFGKPFLLHHILLAVG
jgi:hypothetical protein